ncbi:MAG: adenine-specific methyltransferase EcoRI family protein [Acinetobacter sp.]
MLLSCEQRTANSEQRTANSNKTLSKAKRAKQDEFYTQLNDIANELRHYRSQLEGKVIYCNCDDPFESKFFQYFALNFNALKIKKLITTSYIKSPIAGNELPLFADLNGKNKNQEKQPIVVEINQVLDLNNDGATDLADVKLLLEQDKNTRRLLKGNGIYEAGDFRSDECIELLKQADVVVTNPPFSLFREYIAQLVEHNKQFLVIGNQNAITYKETFTLIKDNKLWLGVDNGGTKWFQVPDEYDIETESRKKIENGIKYFSMGSIMWFTNMDNPKRHETIPLFRTYNSQDYPSYDDYGHIIEVSKVANIPVDYYGVMGVPITFLDKFNPEQFEILGIANSARWIGYKCYTILSGRKVFNRILIKRKDAME